MNHFLRDREDYKRDLNVLKHYLNDAALYLHQRTGQPIERCKAHVKKQIQPEGLNALKVPNMTVLTRNTFGDREPQSLTFTQFLFDIDDKKRLLSPSMVVYKNPADVKSLAAEFIEVNIQRRGASKRQQFKAKEDGNRALEEFKKNEQLSFKISNNSLSGAQASAATILYNKSAHTSLTSTCRTATSYGNANNEKFLYGNRHYWDPEIVKGNIISIIRCADESTLVSTMHELGLKYPTPEETCAVIKYSTDLYWKNAEQTASINALVHTLSQTQCAAVVYTGDFYHLAQLNPEFVRTFIDRLSSRAITPLSLEESDVYLSQLDADLTAFISLLCAEYLTGTSISALKKANLEHYTRVGATAKHILETLDAYQTLIRAFWRTDTLPASVGHIRNSLRRGVITSDTDSTIFTVQYWTEWFTGHLDFSEKSKAVGYAVTYLATQTIAHVLAQVSASLGVEKEKLFTLTMKNEFAFPVFVLTSMAKHYFAYISAREGKVYSELETEIKGVYLKDSNAPRHVMTTFHETLKWCMDGVMAGTGILAAELLSRVATLEKDVERSIRNGDTDYLNGAQVKDPTSYIKPSSSPYVYYGFWEDVWAPKYGHSPIPPYAAVKVSVDLKNPTKVKEWIARFEDRALAERLELWLHQHQKVALSMLLLPRSIVETGGIPPEIVDAMDLRKLIYGTVKPFYILLDALGLCYINDDLTLLVSDRLGHLALPQTTVG